MATEIETTPELAPELLMDWKYIVPVPLPEVELDPVTLTPTLVADGSRT